MGLLRPARNRSISTRKLPLSGSMLPTMNAHFPPAHAWSTTDLPSVGNGSWGRRCKTDFRRSPRITFTYVDRDSRFSNCVAYGRVELRTSRSVLEVRHDDALATVEARFRSEPLPGTEACSQEQTCECAHEDASAGGAPESPQPIRSRCSGIDTTWSARRRGVRVRGPIELPQIHRKLVGVLVPVGGVLFKALAR